MALVEDMEDDSDAELLTDLPSTCGALAADSDESLDEELSRYIRLRELWMRWEPLERLAAMGSVCTRHDWRCGQVPDSADRHRRIRNR